MKKLLSFIVLALFGASLTGWAADTDTQQAGRRMHAKKNFLASLNLTDAQKKDMARLKLENGKQAIELRAKAETSKLELRHLLMADAPDQAAIAKKMSEAAAREAELRMNKVDGWFAINKMLTPDQQKVWKQALRAGTLRAAKGNRDGMQDGAGRPGRMGMRQEHRRMAPPGQPAAPLPGNQ